MSDDPVDPPTPPVAAEQQTNGWRVIRRALAPQLSLAQVVAALLCMILGFAFVTQVRQNRDQSLSTLRQDDLVRILDDVSRRTDQLEEEAASLRSTRSELLTGSDTRRAAEEAAIENAGTQGILAGRLPATGPGIVLTVTEDPDDPLSALVLFNVLEELRNAGAEAVQLNDIRLTASSFFLDGARGVTVDGQTLEPPYVWLAIGNPQTMSVALSIQGGALSVVRTSGGRTSVVERDTVEVTATRELTDFVYASPAPTP